MGLHLKKLHTKPTVAPFGTEATVARGKGRGNKQSKDAEAAALRIEICGHFDLQDHALEIRDMIRSLPLQELRAVQASMQAVMLKRDSRGDGIS